MKTSSIYENGYEQKFIEDEAIFTIPINIVGMMKEESKENGLLYCTYTF